MIIDIAYDSLLLFNMVLKNKLKGKIHLNLDELFNMENSSYYSSEKRPGLFEMSFKYDIAIDKSKLSALSEEFNINEFFFEYMCILYKKITQFQDCNQVALKSFQDDYAGDMMKIRNLLKQTKGKSPLFVKIDSNSEKIDNKNDWFSNLLSSFIDDYLHPDVNFELATNKKIGRPYIDVNRKYFLFLFFNVLTINRVDNKVYSNTLRCLIKFMELLGFTFDLGYRPVNAYIKDMRLEILEIQKNGLSYYPTHESKYFTEINYIKRVEALEAGTIYKTFDDFERYKREPEVVESIIQKNYLSQYLAYQSLKNQNNLIDLSDLIPK